MDAAHRLQVTRVQLAHRGDGVAPRLFEQLGPVLHGQQLARRGHAVTQSATVEPLGLAQPVLPFPVPGEQALVVGEQLLGPPVELQVDHPATQVLAQLVVLGLAVAPAGGDRRYLAGDAQVGHGPRQAGAQALGAQ